MGGLTKVKAPQKAKKIKVDTIDHHGLHLSDEVFCLHNECHPACQAKRNQGRPLSPLL
jgi:hypothetical protein